ncbi:MAG: hypothetical protein KME19_23620 [Microcoleus vaginatus WJT46-NPBG5]|nr:hypothetical protein [Microcoleus vaginatus WJT46-NPBG5]
MIEKRPPHLAPQELNSHTLPAGAIPSFGITYLPPDRHLLLERDELGCERVDRFNYD